MDDTFYKLTPDIALKLCQFQLGANDLKLWMYLSSLDPFGDRKITLPTCQDIAQRLNMSIASFFRAKARLQELGIFSFFDKYTQFINNLGSHSQKKSVQKNYFQICDKDSQICNVVSQICDTTTQICDKDSQICENQALKPLENKASSFSQTINTINTIHTFSDNKIHKKEKCIVNCLEKENSEENKWTEEIQKVNNKVSETIPDTPKDTFTPVSSLMKSNNSDNKGLIGVGEVLGKTSKVQIKAWEWLPDGDWKVDHKLDPIFHDWLANKWMIQYNKTDFFGAKADVLAYFQKAPERLPIRWQQYHDEYTARNLNIEQNTAVNITTCPQKQQSQPNTVVISDGHRTIKSNDYTGTSSKEPEIPVNPKATEMIKNWLEIMKGRNK
jgi:hypothetical protein